MQRRTVLLMIDDNVGWLAVRHGLGTMPSITGTREATRVTDANRIAQSEGPDAIVTAPVIGDDPVFPLLARLRLTLPATTFVVIAERYEADQLLSISSIGIASFLLWQDLSALGLRCTLAAAISGRFVVLSNAVSAAHIAAERGRNRSSTALPAITMRERAILRGLFEGLTQKQIALIEGVSVSTVARIIQRLEDKLDSPDRFVLGAEAAALGLVP